MTIKKVAKNKIMIGIALGTAIINDKEEISYSCNPNGLVFNTKDSQYFISYESIIKDLLKYKAKQKGKGK